jgi:hypothetical protein
MRHNYYDVKKIFKELEDSGFDGVLLAYGQNGDPFTVLANAIDKDSSMEYIVAVRPHLISPQYVSEIVNSFESFAPGKISINVVPGEITEKEKAYGGVIGTVNDSSSPEQRRKLLGLWVEEYMKCRKSKNKVYVSGHHLDTIRYSDKADALIMNYHMLNQLYASPPAINNFYISMSPVIGGNPKKTSPDNIVATPEEFHEVVKNMESMGVEGLLFHNTYSEQIYYLMDYVKKYKNISVLSH